MLRYDTFQDIIFDMDSALSIKGFTGPYIEYTHARASSVLNRAGYSASGCGSVDVLQKHMSLDTGESADQIMRIMCKFPEVVLESAKKYAPNLLCNYLYALCQEYNSFYNDSPIINAESQELKEFRLLLTSAVRQVIKNGLYLLGINAVDRM